MPTPTLVTPEEHAYLCDAVRTLFLEKKTSKPDFELDPDFGAYVARRAYEKSTPEDTRRAHARVELHWEMYSPFFPIGREALKIGLEFKEFMQIFVEHGARDTYKMLFNEDPQPLKTPISRN